MEFILIFGCRTVKNSASVSNFSNLLPKMEQLIAILNAIAFNTDNERKHCPSLWTICVSARVSKEISNIESYSIHEKMEPYSFAALNSCGSIIFS